MFYKVDDKTGMTIRVHSKQLVYGIQNTENNMMLVYDVIEDYLLKECTEEEFTSAYKEALERITTGKI